MEDSKTRVLTLEEWKEIGTLSGWTEITLNATKAIDQRDKAKVQKSEIDETAEQQQPPAAPEPQQAVKSSIPAMEVLAQTEKAQPRPIQRQETQQPTQLLQQQQPNIPQEAKAKGQTSNQANAALLGELLKAKERELSLTEKLANATEELKIRADEMRICMEEMSKDGKLKDIQPEEFIEVKKLNKQLVKDNNALQAKVKEMDGLLSDTQDTMKLRDLIADLKMKIQRLKMDSIPPEKYEDAVTEANGLKTETLRLQAENTGLAQSLQEAKLRADTATKLANHLSDRLNDLSIKYENLTNAFMKNTK